MYSDVVLPSSALAFEAITNLHFCTTLTPFVVARGVATVGGWSWGIYSGALDPSSSSLA